MIIECPHHPKCYFHGSFSYDINIAYEDHLLQAERNKILEKWLTEIVSALRHER